MGKHLVFHRGRLKIGGDLGYSKLVRELSEKCDRRALTPLTWNMLQGGDPKETMLAGLAEFSRHTRWRFFLRHSETEAA
jgi:hypothetical protein